MKNRFLSSLFVVIALLSSPLVLRAQDAPTRSTIAKSAYERVAPYVNKTTFLTVRVDVDSLDAQEISNSFDEIFKGCLREREFDRNSFNATNREFSKTLTIVRDELSGYLSAVKEFGVRELFFIVQNQDDDSFRIVIPIANSKKDAFAAFIRYLFPNWTVFDLPRAIGLTNDLEKDTERYKKFKSETNPVVQKFLSDTAGSTVQIYFSGLKIKKLLTASDEDEQKEIDAVLASLPKEATKALDAFDAHFHYALISFNLNKFSFNSSYVFSTANRAEEVRLGLVSLVDFVANKIVEEEAKELKETDPNDDYNTIGLSRELLKGFLARWIPSRSNATLVFESNLKTDAVATHPVILLFTALNGVLVNSDPSEAGVEKETKSE